jgi:succinate dehydrogenase hydrophobic anchor subunit
MPKVEVPDEVVSVDPDAPSVVETMPPSTPMGTRISPLGPGRDRATEGDDAFDGIDWSGRGAKGGSDDDGVGDADAGADGGSGTRRLAAVAGAISFAYVAWVVVDLVVLWLSPSSYTTMHDALDVLGVRLALTGAWLALLYHGLDGVRVVLLDAVPRLRTRDRGLRAAVIFLLFATWIPTSLVLLWPSISSWFAP